MNTSTNNIHAKPSSLRFVSMPIIELMRSAELSWADIEKCADALLCLKRRHESMVSDRSQALVGAQQESGVSDLAGHVGRAA